MRRILYLGFTIFAILLVSLSAHGEIYTLDKCIETGLQNNYSVIAARNNFDASRWGVYNAYSDILPSISISGGGAQNKGYLSIEGQSIPLARKQTNYSGSINFGQTYPGLGLYTYANIKLQTARRNSNLYGFVGAQNDLALNIKQAYYNVIQTKMLVDVSQDAVKRAEEQLKIAQSRYDLGSASLSDVLKAKVQRSNAQLDLISAQNNYSNGKSNLKYVMGVDMMEDVEIDEHYPQITIDITYDQAYNEALSRNPAYRQAQFSLLMNKAQQWIARTSFLPSVSLSYNRSTSVIDTFSNFFDFRPIDASYSIRVGLSFNIFNNLGDTYNLVSANKNLNSAQENLANEKNNIGLQVQQAYLNLQMNEEALKVNEEAMASAQEDWNIVKEKYNLGAATMLDVLDAEVSYKQAQINQVQAQFNYNIAAATLENVMGR